MVQWLRLCAPNAGGPGSIPGQGTRSRMLQLNISHTAMKIPHAATKTQHGQINIFFERLLLIIERRIRGAFEVLTMF